MDEQVWTGCYSQRWGDVLPDMRGYPASVAPLLARRIYNTALDLGLVPAGGRVIDFFAGEGAFGYHALYRGLLYIGVTPYEATVNPRLKGWRTRFAMLGHDNWGCAVAPDSKGIFPPSDPRGLFGQANMVVGLLPYDPNPKNWPDYKYIADSALAVLCPGGLAVWVTSDYVYKKRNDSVTASWVKGCEYVGFQPVLHARAELYEFHARQRRVDDSDLLLGKFSTAYYPRPDGGRSRVRAEHQDVVFMQKPE